LVRRWQPLFPPLPPFLVVGFNPPLAVPVFFACPRGCLGRSLLWQDFIGVFFFSGFFFFFRHAVAGCFLRFPHPAVVVFFSGPPPLHFSSSFWKTHPLSRVAGFRASRPVGTLLVTHFSPGTSSGRTGRFRVLHYVVPPPLSISQFFFLSPVPRSSGALVASGSQMFPLTVLVASPFFRCGEAGRALYEIFFPARPFFL